TTTIPSVTAAAASEQSKVIITEAADLSEQTVIEVIAEDGITQTYRLSFVHAEEGEDNSDDTSDEDENENTDDSTDDKENVSDDEKNNNTNDPTDDKENVSDDGKNN